MDRSRGKQYEKPNKFKPSPYVAMADIQTAARPGVQHKDPALGYLSCWSKL